MDSIIDLTPLSEAFSSCKEQLKGIVSILKREPIRDPHLTYAYYSDGTYDEYDLSGTVVGSQIKKKSPITSAPLTASYVGDEVTVLCGTFSHASSMVEVFIPHSVSALKSRTFYDCINLSCITCDCIVAPEVSANTARQSPFDGTGLSTSSLSINVLKVPQGATGYDNTFWTRDLLAANACNFHIEYY